MTQSTPSAVAHAFRRAALPLVCYYGVALGLPVANGAARSGPPFALHAAVVLIVPILLILMTCAVSRIAHALFGQPVVRK